METLANMSMERLSDFLAKTDEAVWRMWINHYGTVDRVIVVLVFLFLFLFSNLAAYIIRIYNDSLPFLNVNVINTINMYIVEIINFILTIVTISSIWVVSVSCLPFTIAYLLGLIQASLAFLAGGLATIVGILKVLKVLQVIIFMKALINCF